MFKIERGTFPSGHSSEDFRAFGPAATKDGDFNNVMLVDLGCFNQEGVDSNKFYHASIVQSTKTEIWYLYLEWGRTGAKNPQFQFVECKSKEEAQKELIRQCMEKNVRRGEWVEIAGIKTLRAKPKKDCYLVRPQAKRTTGLSDARRITEVTQAVVVSSAKKIVDDETMRLMKDLNLGVVNYTRSSMADAALPTKSAIEEARLMLHEAKKRLLVVGSDIDRQVNDAELKTLTSQVYGRIPKIKPLRVKPETWILSGDTIPGWEQDLDAYESALTGEPANEYDPFSGMELKVEYLSDKSDVGQFLRRFLPKATNNRNNYSEMKIHNIWKINHFAAEDDFRKKMKEVGEVKQTEKPLFQPDRIDLSKDDVKDYHKTNTCFMVHGSRSVNVSSILRKRLCMPATLVGVTLTAWLMGPGIYVSEDWQKAAHYTSHPRSRYARGSGAISGRHAFLFLTDVILGKVYVASDPHPYTSAPNKYHSVMGKAGYTKVTGGSTLINNEFIVYNSSQQQIRYLVEFS